MCPPLQGLRGIVAAGKYSLTYDCNGNAIKRFVGSAVSFLAYNAENQLISVTGATTATFVYDGDGQRVRATAGGITTTYISNYYEWNTNTSLAKKYYYARGQRVGMRDNATLSVIMTDQLGST